MAHHEAFDLQTLGWIGGWFVAVVVLLLAGLRLPLQTRLGTFGNGTFQMLVLIAGAAATVLANVAIILNDQHFDLTREKAYTPSAQALQVVDELQQPVAITYFVRGQDPAGQRMASILEQMARRNPRFRLLLIDPDREPAAARNAGLRSANAAIIEAADRRVQVETTDERQIAIGIQRVLRQNEQTFCFVEGHNELPVDNFEFHTHVDSVSDHRHDDATSAMVMTEGHGIGRFRRALETQGYSARRIELVAAPQVPDDCTVVVLASPRTTFLPAETRAIERYLAGGGAMLAMFDLGFVPDPAMLGLLTTFGITLPQTSVVDPLSHYARDAEMVAVAGYEPGPVLRGLSMSFFPGVRPLVLQAPAEGLRNFALFHSSRDSYERAVRSVRPEMPGERDVAPAQPPSAAAEQPLATDTGQTAGLDVNATAPSGGEGVSVSGGEGASASGGEAVTAPAPAPAVAPAPAPQVPVPGPRVLAAAVEGRLPAAAPDQRPMRAVIVGDGDFASNSFLPYLANSDLALSMARWLLREERMTAVPTRIPVASVVALSNRQQQAIFLMLVIAMPLTAMVFGLFVWWRRR